MRASTSVLSRYAKRLFTRDWATAPLWRADRRPRRRDHAPLYAAAEVLENRAMLSAPSLASAVGIGSAGVDTARAVATDSAGNRYVTGSFSGTVNFNPNGTNTSLTAQGTKDAFVAVYAPDNTLLWVRQMGGSGATAGGSGIKVDASGNVYVAGSTSAAATFGSTTLSAGGYVEKLSADGTIQWARNLGSGSGSGVGVGVDSSGNVYALGETVPANINYQITKFSSTGATRWSEAINAQGMLFDAGFAVDGRGNVYLGGAFTGTVNFSPTGRSHYVSAGPSESAFVLKLNTNGAYQWVSPFVGQTVGSTNGFSAGESLALDGSGNIVVGGVFGGSVNFDPGSGTTILSTSSPTVYTGFITKLNSSGGLVWAEALQSSYIAYVRGLAVDSAGSIYVTGTYSGTIALNPADSSQTWTGPGTYVVKLDAGGNFVWGASLGGVFSWGLAVEANGAIDVVGQFENTANFNPDPNGPPDYLTSAGSWDAFLLKLNQS